MTTGERELWRQVYVASIAAGNDLNNVGLTVTAALLAKKAVDKYRELK